MTEPWKVRSLAVENLVGYKRLVWPRIDSDFNLLLGQNGVGKSMLLETLIAALRFLQGRHARDTFVGHLPDVAIEVALVGDSKARRFSTSDITSIQGSRQTGWTCRIFHVVENRQPKNKVGRMGAVSDDNPIMRYPASLAKLQGMLRSRANEDIAFVATVREYCQRLPQVATHQEWERIWTEVRDRGPNATRPISCGQFDALAVVVDLVSFQQALAAHPVPHFVVFDNPETYLHPAVVRPMFDVLRDALPAAQFFVASHGIRGVFYPEHKSVFFLPRDARTKALVELLPLAELPRAGLEAFVELYGTEAGSGFLSLVGELESPGFHRFLCDCVYECGPRERKAPRTDRQLSHAVSLLEDPVQTVLDVGAGHGEVLDALEVEHEVARPFLYFAYDIHPQAKLISRIKHGIASGLLSPGSRVLSGLDDVDSRCDTALFLNLCHHLEVSTLAEYLAVTFQRHIQRCTGAGLLVVELRTLATGERNFILWTPEDFHDLFAPWPDLTVTSRPRDGDFPEEGHDATLIRWTCDDASAEIESGQLAERLWDMLPEKRAELLQELEGRRKRDPEPGMATYWHQKRVAFLCASLAWIARAEWLRPRSGEPQ